MIVVELNSDELTAGAAVGARRHISALHRPDKNFPDDDNLRWQTHIEGALSEIAVAKYLNRYWTGCGLQSRFDVGVEGLQVRSILNPSYGLVLRESDAYEDAYLLVHAQAPRYTLLGWLRGSEGKCDYWLRSNERADKPFWIVPVQGLRPVESLLV